MNGSVVYSIPAMSLVFLCGGLIGQVCFCSKLYSLWPSARHC